VRNELLSLDHSAIYSEYRSWELLSLQKSGPIWTTSRGRREKRVKKGEGACCECGGGRSALLAHQIEFVFLK
jgi:hypothetical protein